jgi:hypothetical protein
MSGAHSRSRLLLRILNSLPATTSPSDALESSHASFLTAKWPHLPHPTLGASTQCLLQLAQYISHRPPSVPCLSCYQPLTTQYSPQYTRQYAMQCKALDSSKPYLLISGPNIKHDNPGK